MMICAKKIICVAVVLAAVTTGAWAEDPYQVAWIAQIGTSEWDHNTSVTVDASGNVYISGFTDGDLGGPNAGDHDAFLSKFDSGGNEVWTTQIGTSSYDWARSVAVDAFGNAYITGYTGGDLSGTSAGGSDAFLSKFDFDGNEVWTTQFGSSSNDYSNSIAMHASGNVYISGYTHGDLGGPNAGSGDPFLRKFDSGGNEVWTTQIGSSSLDYSWSVAVDASGYAYISGHTYGDIGGPNAGEEDAYLSKFDSSGNEVWTTQIGTSDRDDSKSVALDASGNIYISGTTESNLGGASAGGKDAYLSKFDSGGNEIWTTQIGTSSTDFSYSVAVDASGNVYISGGTYGDLGGPNAGWSDAFLSKFDSGGNEVWTTQIGTDRRDSGWSVAVDASGNVYITGDTTYGDLGGPNAGGTDVFLVKYEVPEPATLSLLALGSLALLRRRRKRQQSLGEQT